MIAPMAMAMLLLGNVHASCASYEIHVSPHHGDDTNSGLQQSPLRTLIAARDAARRMHSPSPASTVNVVLHAEGVHHLAGPLLLDARDSHTNFLAAAGEGDVLVSGGIRVDEAAVTPRPGHAGQFQANLTALGLADLGTVLPAPPNRSGHEYAGVLHPQLFVSQRSGLLARWPNARNQTSWQWAYTKDCLSKTCSSNCNCSGADITGFSWRTSQTNGSGTPPAVAHRWGAESDPYLHGYWRVDWRDGYLPLTGVDVARDGLLVGEKGAAAAPLSKVKTGSRYLAFNLLAELDDAGEYYVSRSGETKGMLYFQPPAGTWPPPAGSDDLAGAYVSSAAHLVVLQTGAEWITFQGISWQHARSTVITSAGATVSHIVVDGCTVANSGGAGIDLIGFHNTVSRSKVFNVGGTGVSVKGGLHRSLTRGGNLVTHNEIHHYAQWVRTYQPAILWAGVGNVYSFNHIHDAPHNGILGGGNEATCSTNGSETTIVEQMCGGNDCIFESNVIEHTNYECDDSGSFYTCGQQGTAFINRGNVLRNNTFRRIRQEDKTFLGYPSVQAIYLDDQMSGWLIEGNTVIDAQMGIMVGGGRDVVVKGNSFIRCDKALHIDNRGMTNEKPSCLGPDMTSIKAAMGAPAWTKYGLSSKMNPAEICSPVNASAINNCFSQNIQNWEVWCGAEPSCMNDAKWSGSQESGNTNGTTCGQP